MLVIKCIKNFFNESINKYAPVDFELIGYYSDETKSININEFIEDDNIIKNNTKDITIVTDYYDKNLNYGSSLGEYENEVRDRYPNVRYDSPVYIIGVSDYNKLAKIYNCDTIKLENDEYAIVSNYETDIYKLIYLEIG